MKSKLTGCVLIVLVLAGVTASTTLVCGESIQAVEAKNKQCVRQGEEKVSGENYALKWVAWSERIWVSRRKRRPYRNPFRRYRLRKKKRLQLCRCLCRLTELAEEFSGVAERAVSPTEDVVVGASCFVARWG